MILSYCDYNYLHSFADIGFSRNNLFVSSALFDKKKKEKKLYLTNVQFSPQDTTDIQRRVEGKTFSRVLKLPPKFDL